MVPGGAQHPPRRALTHAGTGVSKGGCGGEGASGRHERREGGGGKGSGKGSDIGDGGFNGHVQASPWKRQTNQG